MRFFRHARVALLGLALAVSVAGCENFDPSSIGDLIPDSKKKLPGERKELFPGGVPGVTQGVPDDLVKGHQPPPDPAQAQVPPEPQPQPEAQAEEQPKPKPKPKRKVVRAPKPPAQDTQPAQSAQPQQSSPWPAQPQQQQSNAQQSPWPAPQQSNAQQSPWPATPAR